MNKPPVNPPSIFPTCKGSRFEKFTAATIGGTPKTMTNQTTYWRCVNPSCSDKYTVASGPLQVAPSD
jgi:hypothetical protein